VSNALKRSLENNSDIKEFTNVKYHSTFNLNSNYPIMELIANKIFILSLPTVVKTISLIKLSTIGTTDQGKNKLFSPNLVGVL
jgi:hypothetical protein